MAASMRGVERFTSINWNGRIEDEGEEKQEPKDPVPGSGCVDCALPGDRGMLPAGRAGTVRDSNKGELFATVQVAWARPGAPD